MKVLNSLIHKIVFSLCILLALIAFYVYSDFSSLYHISNELIRINHASQLPLRSYEMAWLARTMAEREAAIIDEGTRKGLVARLQGEIAAFDRILKDLRHGNSTEGLEELTYEEALLLLDRIEGDWTSVMKPALVGIAELPSSASEKEARKLLEPFDDGLPRLAYAADMLVDFLQKDYRREMKEHRQIKLYILGFLLVSAAVIIIYVNRRILQPVQSLQQAAKEIEKGNYDVHVDVKTKDEIGRFGQAFNRMAEEISGAFGELMWHAKDVMALNRSLHRFVGIRSEQELYQTFCDQSRDLFGLSASWLGLVDEGNHDVRIVAWAGFDNSRMQVTWDDSSYGMGPPGMAIKTNLPQIINDMDAADASLPGIKEALRQGFRSCMAQPLIFADCVVVGVLVLYSERKGHFTPQIAELCQIFSSHAAAILENMMLLGDLERRVQERTRSLQDALLLAQGANMAKSSFLSNMSHDLRTPLNAIIGFSEAMSQGIYGELRPDHKEYIEYIYQSGMKLLKLINEVLDLSKMETGSMGLDYAQCNISDIINHVIYVFQEKAKKHRIRITPDIAGDARFVTVDVNKIKQVLVNLLTDSVGATRQGGAIRIEGVRVACDSNEISGDQEADAMTAKKQTGTERPCIQITITDARPALSDEDRLRFFDPYRLFDTTHDRKQDNVGLLLSKRYVELHGGRIWAEGVEAASEEGGSSDGNRFILILPQQP